MEKRILLALHEVDIRGLYSRLAEDHGYQAATASTLREAVQALKEQGNYAAIVMDPNLGKPGTNDITAFYTIYSMVGDRVRDGTLQLYAESSTPGAIAAAEKIHGVHAQLRGNPSDLFAIIKDQLERKTE